jgi:GNAT superfamily N-acetyltransferase
MGLTWIRESPAHWDSDKARVVGGASPGIFDPELARRAEGEVLPNDWWRVESDGRTVAYGWMDVTWGDAEILLVVDPDARGQGVGTFVLDHLEQEAWDRGLRYLYNVVPDRHPAHEQVKAWLESRRFAASDDGKLMRAVVREPDHAAAG